MKAASLLTQIHELRRSVKDLISRDRVPQNTSHSSGELQMVPFHVK
ncbi:hypothetical protein TNIN_45461, partial [Trichonephila inaurata madagascariensis]